MFGQPGGKCQDEASITNQTSSPTNMASTTDALSTWFHTNPKPNHNAWQSHATQRVTPKWGYPGMDGHSHTDVVTSTTLFPVAQHHPQIPAKVTQDRKTPGTSDDCNCSVVIRLSKSLSHTVITFHYGQGT